MAKMEIVRNVVVGYNKAGVALHEIEAEGSEGDDYPTKDDVGGEIVGTSFALETDTGKVSFYDRKTEAWINQFSFQG